MGFKFERGVKLRDKITGFEGVVTGRADYITGCNQYVLTMPEIKDGEKKALWFDENRLEYIDDGVREKFTEEDRKVGGPYGGAPTK